MMKHEKAPRTSTSHPLRIDAVGVPNSNGEIGMTLCPGRRDVLSADGPWERDLTADLAVIAQWKPALVITLVEDFEFELLGVPEFPDALRQSDVVWRQLPIRDGGVPGDAFEANWTTVGAEARRYLASGGRVLLHCRAGLGRTGMIAARLLVELGKPPEDAIRGVRKARPGAIETSAQAQHVRACKAVA